MCTDSMSYIFGKHVCIRSNRVVEKLALQQIKSLITEDSDLKFLVRLHLRHNIFQAAY